MEKMIINMAAVSGGVNITYKSRGVEMGAVWSREEVREIIVNLCKLADLPAPWK